MAESGQQSLWPSPVSGARSWASDSRYRARTVFAHPGGPGHIWICLYFNKLSIEIYFNSNIGADDRPHAVLASRKNRAQILLCNSTAAHLGVCPGQTVHTALALAPDLEIADRDSAGEARVMRELAARALRFTPAVHIDTSNALLLDVQGSLKFFGGLEKLRAALVNDLADRGHRFAIGCAPTALAALWLARSGRGGNVRDCSALPGRLGDLPIDCLRWPAEVQRMLAGMGIRTIGQCIRLPRDGLARRLGPDRLAELDQGFGARPEVRAFHRPARSFDRTLELPAETTDVNVLLAGLQKLLARLESSLRRHQGAVRVLWIRLHHQGRPAALERIGLLHASTDITYLMELARIRFTGLRLEAPVVSVGLQTVLAMPTTVSGRDLLGDRTDRKRDTFALVEQLRIRLGAEAVHGIRPVPEHRPEVAWKTVIFSAAPAERYGPADAVAADFRYDPVRHRPAWMLAEPRALNAPGGRPVFGGALRFEGDAERIETGWWDGRDVRRDYYPARNRHGIRLWVFRDCGGGNGREPRWYLHGLFG
ncbi:MAG: DNA polymerase Y family protein [Gammaproteobacteria bacterium]